MVTVPGPALVTVPNVEIALVGEDWPASTGAATFTLEDLESAVEAQADPAIRTPVLKLGHVDPRFDGEPCFGKIVNLRVDYDRQALVGDITGVPAWLGEPNEQGQSVLNSAFPDRSLEGYFHYQVTPQGKTHKFALTALALLGVTTPAIQSLADIGAAFGVAASGEPHSGKKVVVHMGAKPRKVAASDTQVEDVRRAFYDQVAQGDNYWWWIRAMFIEPPYVVVDDDEGGLYRLDYSVKGDDIEFGEPQAVEIEYVPKTNAVAASRRVGPLVTYSSSQESRPATMAGNTDQEGISVTIKEQLGLPETATDEEVAAKIAELQSANSAGQAGENTPPAPEVPVSDGGPGGTEPVSPPSSTVTASAGLQLPPGVTLIDEGTLRQLQAGAQTAAALAKKEQVRERDALLSAAVKDGKFSADRKTHFAALYDVDPEGTKATLAALAANTVPVLERGYDGGTGTEIAASSPTEYPSHWLPDVQRQKALLAAQTGPRIIETGA